MQQSPVLILEMIFWYPSFQHNWVTKLCSWEQYHIINDLRRRSLRARWNGNDTWELYY